MQGEFSHTDHEIQPDTECESCGTYHAVVDSLPPRELTEKEIALLDESEKNRISQAGLSDERDDRVWG